MAQNHPNPTHKDSLSVPSTKGATLYQPGATPQECVHSFRQGLKARPIAGGFVSEQGGAPLGWDGLSSHKDFFTTATRYPHHQIVHQLGAQISRTIVEYTLRDAKSPIGVAEYRLLPSELKSALPKVQQLKKVVSEEVGQDEEASDKALKELLTSPKNPSKGGKK